PTLVLTLKEDGSAKGSGRSIEALNLFEMLDQMRDLFTYFGGHRKDPKVSNHRCPQCHRKMEIIEGKNGAYFRCKYDGTTEKLLD
ncbi:hypothetical protein, partial [Enterococcus faecium]|uniref:hypothetical protein n=1 Tax=Enterococcus faecium TaxID=1352 RepID=UPI00292FCFDD